MEYREHTVDRGARLAFPRRIAVATAVATFCLLLIGGLVHNTRSSLACPDWPLCFGSAFPKMVGGVFYEHSHRLAATTVGLLTIVLTIMMFVRGGRLGLLGLGALGLVIAQGVLGGITVIFRLPTLVSTSHLAVSLLFFCYLIWLAFRMRPSTAQPVPLGRVARRLVAIAAASVYLQSLLGALMRHLGAGLACVDFPLCRGAVWPSGEHPSVLLHATHRLAAVAVGVLVIAAAVAVWRSTASRALKLLAAALPVIVVAQITLGALSVLTFLGVAPVTAHLGGAALLLADLVCLHLATRSTAAAATVVEEPRREIQPA